MATQERFLNPLSDFVFKTIWLCGSEKSKKFLIRIINYITRRDISNYITISSELGKLNYESIANVTDIILSSPDKKVKINIEVNRFYYGALENRNLTFVARIVGDFYNGIAKSKYKNKLDVEQVNINGFFCRFNKEISINEYVLHDVENDIVRDGIKIKNIYIPNYKNMCYDTTEEVNNDIAMLACSSYDEMKSYVNDNEERKSFMEDLKKLSTEESYLYLYDKAELEEAMKWEAKSNGYEEGHADGLAKGHDEGYAEGVEESLNKFVLSLYRNDIKDLDKISIITKLPKEKVEELIDEYKNK